MGCSPTDISIERIFHPTAMSYKRPSDEKLDEALVSVLLRCQIIESQSELVRMIVKELEKDGETYRISGKRIRRYALENGMLTLEIDSRGSKNRKIPDVCPVCRNDLTSVTNSTLDGDTVELMRKCKNCGYVSSARGSIPSRYVFIRKSRGISL